MTALEPVMSAQSQLQQTAAAPPSKRLTVGLLWHSLSSGNLGVGALTESHIAILARVAERLGIQVHFVVLGTGQSSLPGLATELQARGHALSNHPVRVLRATFRAQARACDLVLDIGEGDSFATIYGFKRFFFYWLSKYLVQWTDTPLGLAPQTIGPFDSKLTRAMAAQVMRGCEFVFARDSMSRRYLSDLRLDQVADEATDVAFALPFVRPQRALDGRIRVGINVSGLLFSGGYTGDNQFGLSLGYAATIRRLVAEFSRMPDVELHLVSHVIEPHRPVENDMAAARQLANAHPSVIVAPAFTRPSEAKSYISGLDFFTGARMHACIAALSSGVPVVPMAYSRKFNGLFGSLGYPHLADCKQDSEDAVVSKI
jgi:colanic acid/amylovoran biosynthesis protein